MRVNDCLLTNQLFKKIKLIGPRKGASTLTLTLYVKMYVILCQVAAFSKKKPTMHMIPFWKPDGHWITNSHQNIYYASLITDRKYYI